jgi:MFS family permease
MQVETGPWYRGLSRYQWLVLFVAWLGWVFDIADSAVFNLTKIPALTELAGAAAYKDHGPAIEGLIQLVFLGGWSIGGLFFGILADRWGRTKTLVITVLIYSALTALTALVHSVDALVAMRFFTALGIGGEWAAGAALVAEALPDRARAPAAGLLQTAAAIGPVLAALGNQVFAAESWRVMYVLGALPALITVFIRLYVPEPEKSKRAETRSDAGSLKSIFGDPKLRRFAIIAMIIGVVGIAGSNNLSFWMPNLVKEASAGFADAAIRSRTSIITYCMHVGTLLGVFIFPYLCVKWGRKPSFALFFLLSPIAIAIATYGGTGYERLMWAAPLMSFFVIGLTSGYALYLPELFPAHLRATGAGLAYNVGRIGTIPVPWLTGLIIGGSSVPKGVFTAGLAYVIGLIAIPFAPETKGQGLPQD